MIKEFEGRNEQEAIDRAVEELNLKREDFNVEILDAGSKWGLFKKSSVKIRIHVNEPNIDASHKPARDEFEKKVTEYVKTILSKMGYPAEVHIAYRRDNKIGLTIISDHSGIIIGKKGKNLDALQLLVNVYAGLLDDSKRVIIDAENYRIRHEEHLIKTAYKSAEYVKKYKRSKLLEPMNPFERRLIHTALNDIIDVETKSEGEGLYKQIRISYKGGGRRQ